MRNLIIATLYDLPNLPGAANRVLTVMLSNFYNTFRLFYGPEISQLFLNYLTSFLANYLQLVNAYKNNDTAEIDSSTTQWHQSADALAAFLSHINLFWDENQWRYLLDQFIQLKITEIIAFISNNIDLEMSLFFSMQS